MGIFAKKLLSIIKIVKDKFSGDGLNGAALLTEYYGHFALTLDGHETSIMSEMPAGGATEQICAFIQAVYSSHRCKH